MKEVLIISESKSPRLRYVCDFLAERYSNLSLSIHLGPNPQTNLPKIYYTKSQGHSTDILWIPFSSGILEGSDLTPKEFEFQEQMPILFKDPSSTGFDLFYAIFWILSRAEEYHSSDRDIHGRWKASSSLLYKHRLLQLPVIDLWVDWFESKLFDQFGIVLLKKEKDISMTLGVDIDFMWKYLHKPLLYQIAGFAKDSLLLNWKNVHERWQVLSGQIKDPYDSFDKFYLFKKHFPNIIFFILSGGYSRHDKNHSLKLKKVRVLVQKLATTFDIGLHPSYSSFSDKKQLSKEKDNLENVLVNKINHSRFHFLRMKLPQSYRNLEELYITNDYTMGYAEKTGFRAGSTHSFFWYDLENERKTKLRVHPFIAMDRTYKDYLKYSPLEALNDLQNLWNICQKYGGEFHLIWHNSSFAEAEEWKEYDYFLENFIASIHKIENKDSAE
ncbi:MAG: polysaccharide deacetylase family protein [Saprospiraceae bacterium]|nr:polysaccharide deacetylase family protein [Saprospiraceae bacterium]MBK7810134.1 polysaccharide deacetylase family protein [Saprospiraceae bacterium]MBK9629739.1 polysaccharide deacetylase family protein [Saprospiraceae bacterium]